KAVDFGAESGGVEMAALSVDRLAQWWSLLRDASPRVILLLGGSHGQEALAGVGVHHLAELRGKRIAAHLQGSPYYFTLWALSRVALGVHDVKFVELGSSLEAGSALREGRAGAGPRYFADVGLGAPGRRGGKVCPPPPRA